MNTPRAPEEESEKAAQRRKAELPIWGPVGAAMAGAVGHFLHGVASGDPLANAIVLWTRFTPAKKAPKKAFLVRWLLWIQEPNRKERKPELTGKATAAEEFDFTVKVDVSGLQPGTRYAYRFECGQAKSPEGEFRLPLPATEPMATLSYAVFSCANRGFGNFRAYAAAVERSRELSAPLDFWLHLGDYIYEYRRHALPGALGDGRPRTKAERRAGALAAVPAAPRALPPQVSIQSCSVCQQAPR